MDLGENVNISREMDDVSQHPVCRYIEELTSKIVEESGIPSDKYHVGKIMLRSLKNAPDVTLQIDGTTGERNTLKSALERSIQCATAFTKLGLKYQDLIFIMASNCIDIVIPMYASFYLGIMVAGVDSYLGVNELQEKLNNCEPKIIFCQSKQVPTVQKVFNLLNKTIKIVIFGEKTDVTSHLTFQEFLDNYGGGMNVENFRPTDFDAAETNCLLLSTSGSTGLPKTAVLTHKSIFLGAPFSVFSKYPTPVKLGLLLSPIQWLTFTLQIILGTTLKFTFLLTSSPITQDHVYQLINKYRPDFTATSPTLLMTLYNPNDRAKCDLSCLEFVLIGGCAVPKELIKEMQKINQHMNIKITYGLTEVSGVIFDPVDISKGSAGKPIQHSQYKLVDPTTNNEICEPNVTGELMVKGPTVFKCYYNNPEMTKAAFDENGWLKTGDLFYRDEFNYYYFVDRLKLLLKYKSHQVSPVEIEAVILKHPGVSDVAVTGIHDAECGDLPIALVIPKAGYNVTEQEIKDLVKESLADSKQLRGGVIFVKKFPTTSTSKLDRQKLKELAKTLTKG